MHQDQRGSTGILGGTEVLPALLCPDAERSDLGHEPSATMKDDVVKKLRSAEASPAPMTGNAVSARSRQFDPWSDSVDMAAPRIDPAAKPKEPVATAVLVGRLQALLREHFEAAFSDHEPARLQLMLDAVDTAITNIARTDAPYHNCEHTLLVCLVGQQILSGKQALGDSISAHDWVHYIVSLLFHDVGYVKSLLPGDLVGSRVADGLGGWRHLPDGATDAFLTPFHVDRGVAFVRQLFAHTPLIDVEMLAFNIENTRFPVPEQVRSRSRSRLQWQDLTRAADLIGQLADPTYLQKLPALYAEFLECGTAQSSGLKSHVDLIQQFPHFYSNVVDPLVQVGLEALDAHAVGRRWGESLQATIAQCEAGEY